MHATCKWIMPVINNGAIKVYWVPDAFIDTAKIEQHIDWWKVDDSCSKIISIKLFEPKGDDIVTELWDFWNAY